MRLRWAGLCLLGALAAVPAFAWLGLNTERAGPAQRPNVLLIVADDLGYSDIGSFGGEIRTPNLDALAARGLRLTGFYASPACSPSRAMLLTGSDNHAAGLGTMAELITAEQRGVPGYEGFLSNRTATLAERLQMLGYETMMAGKWHLGKAHGQLPSDRGFTRSFALLQGDHNHFGYDQSAPYRTAGAARDYRLNGQPVEFPPGAYGDDYFTTQILESLKEQRVGRPFFAYLAFSGPHWPLQAPPEDIARYRDRYDAGPAAIQRARLERMEKLGLVKRGAVPFPVDERAWNALSTQERAFETRKMEIYAAMVDRLDQNVGRIVSYLRKAEQLDNTIIIFLSDNGAEGYSLDRPFDLPNPGKVAGTSIDNSLQSIGTGRSYISLGRLWAQVSSTPFRGVKLEMTEGGIRTPAIVSGPGVRRGGINGSVTHVTDVLPTVLDFVQASVEQVVAGRSVITPEGRSWTSLLAERVAAVRSEQHVEGWELLYRRAVRNGRWKAVFQPSLLPLFKERTPLNQVHWQLFDLKRDPGETHDLSAEQPRRLDEMIRKWDRYAASNKVVLPGGAIAGATGAKR